MKHRMRIFGVAGGLSLTALSAPTQAQTMNYANLEDLFGEPVTVSASGSPQKVSDAPVNMEIITMDDIRRSGADNIPDILKSVAGIDVRRYGAADADVGVRGYNSADSSRVLVLLNGREIYVDYHSYTAWATVPVQLEEIRQIEVIKGPNTALYGFNATSGVINIVTLDPIFDQTNSVTARFGTQLNQQLSAVASARLGDQAGLRLSVSEHGSGEFSSATLPPSYGAFPSGAFNRSAYAHGRAELPSGVTVSAEADVTRARLLEMTVGGYPGWTEYSSNREKLGLGSETKLGYLGLNAYRNWVSFAYIPGENCLTCVRIVNTLSVVQLSDLIKPNADHIIRLGAEYRNNRGGGSAYSGSLLEIDDYSASAMWNWQVAPKLALTNSVRYDYATFSYSGPVAAGVLYSASDYNKKPKSAPSYNSALVYNPTAADSFRVSAARAAQIPDFYDLFPQPVSSNPAYSAGLVTAYEGSPLVKPSIINTYEVDYSRKLPALSSAGQIALFQQMTRDVIAPPGDAGITDPATNYGYAGNIGSSSSFGGELSLKGSSDQGWRWKGSYALVQIHDDVIVNGDYANPNSSVDNRHGSPTHVVTLGGGRTWRQFEMDCLGRWQSAYDDIAIANNGTSLARTRINDYLTFDARIGYTPIESVTLAVSGQQLNAKNQVTTAGPPIERRVFGTVTVKF